MSRTSRTGQRWVAAVAATSLVVAGGIALTPSASGALGIEVKKKPTPRGYEYGNWAQPGSGFATGSDDTMSQVYQLTSRSQFPDLDDTPGPIFVAGTFIQSGGTTINRVGRWNANTSSWTTLPGDDTGIGSGAGRTVVSGATVPGVYGMVLGGDDSLYAGGNFETSGSTRLNNMAQWNGSTWIPMGLGLQLGEGSTANEDGYNIQDVVIGNDFIDGDDLNYADDTVYALGGFLGSCANANCSARQVDAKGVMQYSQVDDTWYKLGSGAISRRTTLSGTFDDQVFAGAYIDDTLYVGGGFSTIGGVSAALVAQWNPSAGNWRSLGAGLGPATQNVYAMAVHPFTKDLYVGGTFTQPVGGAVNSTPGIAKWDYSDDTWYSVGTGLTGGNFDDIAFSSDGNTMYVGTWAGNIDGVSANHVARLTSADFSVDSAQTVSGAWDYLKSAGVIGVTGPVNGTINQQAVRAVLTQSDGSVMFGGNFHTAGPVSAGRVATFTPGAEPSPYDPVYPPGAPTDVVAVGGWNKVTVSWKAPTYTGSYPITNYLVTSTPDNRYCISTLQDAKLTECTFTGLTPGTKYTFTVQGLNGGGWGDRSAASNVASPQNLKVTSYSRKKLNFFQGSGSEVKASGIAPGFAPATKIVPWTKIGSGEWVAATSSGLKVTADAKFSWSRKFSKQQNSQQISVRFEIGGNFSNTVVIPPVR